MSGRRYRVVKTLTWSEGGKPASPGSGKLWEGGKVVIYQPGESVFVDDRELAGVYTYLEPIDDADRAALKQVRAADDGEALEIPIASLAIEQRSFLVWASVGTKVAQGEQLRETLIWAIRSGAKIPDDLEFRAVLADALEGKFDPKRGRGRPQKKQSMDLVRMAMEDGIARTYDYWLNAFTENREVAWLKAEEQRLRQEHPEAAVWRGMDDLDTVDGWKSYAAAVAALARPCPPVVQAGNTPRDLALRTTAAEYKEGWAREVGTPLTRDVILRIVTRARKS